MVNETCAATRRGKEFKVTQLLEPQICYTENILRLSG